MHQAAVARKSVSVLSGLGVKAPGDLVGSTSVDPALIPDYRLPPYPARREPQRIAGILPAVATGARTVDYYTTSGTAAAAAVAEGATKPASTIAYTARSAPVVKIAHTLTVTNEVLADFPGFLQVVQQDMIAGLTVWDNSRK